MKNRNWIGNETPLSAKARNAAIRETFEAITTVGFTKWQAEELMGWGYLVCEEDRQHYFREYEKDNFADFKRMAAGATDAQILDTRDYWQAKAKTMGIVAWQGVLSQGRGGQPFYETVAREVADRGLIQKEREQNTVERDGRGGR